ncbi:GntR family transcriptional regulator [Sinomonas sp. R1AF57]|uniref:GntR family transcriptional regulator n=1 Tax=Sinomonas sp. R1AF57 TaxID=2020377 RepID=UPI001C9BC5F2|nr:GntR family transcriptional regulator [Sinomonas sp. R1AF57]
MYNTLLNELLSGAIEPGSRIMIDRLSRTLGVSQSPIREALLRLEAQGLVTKTHLVGYRAAERMSRRQFEELYEMRLLLEPFAANRCAQLAADSQLEELERMTEDMKRESGHDSYASFARQDAAFHEFIAACGGNSLVQDSLSALHGHLHLFRLRFNTQGTNEALREHEQILAALKARNHERAESLMKSHISNSRERLLDAFEDGQSSAAPGPRDEGAGRP